MDKNLPWGAEFDISAPWNDTGKYKYCYNGCELTPYEQEDTIMIDGRPYCDWCASERIRRKKCDPVSDKTHKLVKASDDADYQRLHEQEYDKLPKLKHI